MSSTLEDGPISLNPEEDTKKGYSPGLVGEVNLANDLGDDLPTHELQHDLLQEREIVQMNQPTHAPPKKAGRRKINIEFIEDKSRRHITFSKRKAGIMKKAYELSTLTGTQVLLLVASETGHVYTFATPKLQPLITKPEGKNLIQACLNAPDQPPMAATPPPTRLTQASYQEPPQMMYPPQVPEAVDYEKEEKDRRMKQEVKNMGVDLSSYPNSYASNIMGMYPVPPMAIPRYVPGGGQGGYPQYSPPTLPQMQGQPPHPLHNSMQNLNDLPMPLMPNGQSHDMSKT